MTSVHDMNLKATLTKREPLKASFQIGSAKSDRMTYSRAQKVFSKSDVPEYARQMKAKQIASTRPDTLVGKQPWNQSTLSAKEEEPKDLKRTLLRVRAGLLDEPLQNFKDCRTEEEIEDTVRWISLITGQGPIGKLTTKWFNPIDEKGLARHCIREDWPDFDNATTTHSKEDVKQRIKWFDKLEERRIRCNIPGQAPGMVIEQEKYENPTKSIETFGEMVREKKLIHQEVKEQFKAELKFEFPNASEERLQAVAHRLVDEKLLADERQTRYPKPGESFKPNLPTTKDRRYREFSHAGKWCFSEIEQRFCWSCCMNFGEDSKGCQASVVNPDAWCTLGIVK